MAMWKRGRGQGAYTKESPRILVSEARFTGTLLEWKGSYGWIQPSYRIDHPEASRNSGKVYLSQEDVAEDLPGLGATLSFLAYADGSGIGASDCRVAGEEDEEEEEPSNGGAYAGGWGKGAHAACGKGSWRPAHGGWGQPQMLTSEPFEGTLVKWTGRSGFIRPDYPLDELMGGGWSGDVFVSIDDIEDEISGVGAPVSFTPCFDGRGVRATHVLPVEVPPEQDHSEVCGRVHSALSEGVWAAVQFAGPVEPTWTPQELSKRVTRYLSKGAHSPDLLTMPWDEAVGRYLDRAMQSYTSACGDRPWFLDLDLTQALGGAAWALVQGSPARPRPQRAEVLQMAARGFLDRLHRSRLDKALWEVLEANFDVEKPVLSKMYGFLSRSYDQALKNMSTDTRPVWGLKRAEMFMKMWMNDSMSRTWTALPEPETLITEDSVTWLFECLLAPFGVEDPYSCVPEWLLGDAARRKPKHWGFVRPAVQALFRSWDQPGPAVKRRRRQHEAELGTKDELGEGEEAPKEEANILV